jgi:hypothetical protein
MADKILLLRERHIARLAVRMTTSERFVMVSFMATRKL